jgi:hypothetical protein
MHHVFVLLRVSVVCVRCMSFGRQVNRNGYKQLRNIAVDPMRGRLLNFSKRMRLIKALPLQHLIQIEKSACNTSLLSLVFSSSGSSKHLSPRTIEISFTMFLSLSLSFSHTHTRAFIRRLCVLSLFLFCVRPVTQASLISCCSVLRKPAPVTINLSEPSDAFTPLPRCQPSGPGDDIGTGDHLRNVVRGLLPVR